MTICLLDIEKRKKGRWEEACGVLRPLHQEASFWSLLEFRARPSDQVRPPCVFTRVVFPMYFTRLWCSELVILEVEEWRNCQSPVWASRTAWALVL